MYGLIEKLETLVNLIENEINIAIQEDKLQKLHLKKNDITQFDYDDKTGFISHHYEIQNIYKYDLFGSKEINLM